MSKSRFDAIQHLNGLEGVGEGNITTGIHYSPVTGDGIGGATAIDDLIAVGNHQFINRRAVVSKVLGYSKIVIQ